MRWSDRAGQLLPCGIELVEQERQRVEQIQQKVEQERQLNQRLIDQLRSLGVEPNT